MAGNSNPSDLLTLAKKIVVAHIANNAIAVGDLASTIQGVCNALASVASEGAAAERPRPAVPVKKSVTRDHIICLEDGKKLKMLKRYLRTSYGMTPEQYRQRWGLPPDTRWWRRAMRLNAVPWRRRSALAKGAASAAARRKPVSVIDDRMVRPPIPI